MLSWSEKCVISSNGAANQTTTFAITDTKLYLPVVTISTQDNTKQLEQLKSNTGTKPISSLLRWSIFSRSEKTFCVIIFKWCTASKS